MDEIRKKKVDDEASRGHRAAGIVNDPLFIESMKRLKQEVIDRWSAAPARDTDGREWLWQHYQVALKFEELLVELINTGKMADIERKTSTVEKVARFFSSER